MNFSFGIITTPETQGRIETIAESIRRLNIPEYEIVVVGGVEITGPDITHVTFCDSVKPGWITKKKNLITQAAKYENIVYTHDYLAFEPDFYEGYLKFGNDFDIAMNKIVDIHGNRVCDWALMDFVEDIEFRDILALRNIYPSYVNEIILPYDIQHLTPYMFISGYYWVAKKSVMLDEPLDESRCWNELEDVEWCKRVREKYPFKLNIHSTVKAIKEKTFPHRFVGEDFANKLRGLRL